MARLSMKLPYSKIKIYDTEYIVQFKVIEQQKKVECLIFADGEIFVRGVAKCMEGDEKFYDEALGKEFSFDNAMKKFYQKVNSDIKKAVKSIEDKASYTYDQLKYKCFKTK